VDADDIVLRGTLLTGQMFPVNWTGLSIVNSFVRPWVIV